MKIILEVAFTALVFAVVLADNYENAGYDDNHYGYDDGIYGFGPFGLGGYREYGGRYGLGLSLYAGLGFGGNRYGG